MKKVCIKDFTKNNAWFIAGSSYEFSFDPYNIGYVLLTDSRGVVVDMSINTFQKYFI